MTLIRLLHPREYDKHRGRFLSSCFADSSDGTGISLVDSDCITAHSPAGGICRHIERYYPSVVGEPIAYWIIPANLPPHVQIEETESDTGDPCHRELHGFPGKTSQKFFKRSYRPENICLCLNRTPVPGTQELLDKMF